MLRLPVNPRRAKRSPIERAKNRWILSQEARNFRVDKERLDMRGWHTSAARLPGIGVWMLTQPQHAVEGSFKVKAGFGAKAFSKLEGFSADAKLKGGWWAPMIERLIHP